MGDCRVLIDVLGCAVVFIGIQLRIISGIAITNDYR